MAQAHRPGNSPRVDLGRPPVQVGSGFLHLHFRLLSSWLPISSASSCKSPLLFLLAAFVSLSSLFSLPAHLVFLLGDPSPALPYGSPLNKVWRVQRRLAGPLTCSLHMGPSELELLSGRERLSPSWGRKRGSPGKAQGRPHTSLVHLDSFLLFSC